MSHPLLKRGENHHLRSVATLPTRTAQPRSDLSDPVVTRKRKKPQQDKTREKKGHNLITSVCLSHPLFLCYIVLFAETCFLCRMYNQAVSALSNKPRFFFSSDVGGVSMQGQLLVGLSNVRPYCAGLNRALTPHFLPNNAAAGLLSRDLRCFRAKLTAALKLYPTPTNLSCR